MEEGGTERLFHAEATVMDCRRVGLVVVASVCQRRPSFDPGAD